MPRVMVRRVTTGEWGTNPTAGDVLAQEAHALWQTWRKGDDPALLLEPAPLVFSRGDPNLGELLLEPAASQNCGLRIQWLE